MLFDPKWEKPKTDPHSLDAVMAWLEQQPADQEYDWFDIKGCLACRYLQFLGESEPWANGSYRELFGTIETYHQIAGKWPWTFGAALERARAFTEAR